MVHALAGYSPAVCSGLPSTCGLAAGQAVLLNTKIYQGYHVNSPDISMEYRVVYSKFMR